MLSPHAHLEIAHVFTVKANRVSLWYTFAEACAQHRNERAIWSRQGSWTFGEMHDQAVRYAQWLLDQGVKPGELVAMYMKNSPEFVIVWFAMLCVGAAPAFINWNLESNALLHCLDVAETRLIIVDDEPAFLQRVNASKEGIETKGTKIVVLDESLKREVTARKAVVPGDEFRSGVTGAFPFCLIYTRSV